MGFNVECTYCYDMNGKFLWLLQQPKRLWKVGDVFTRDGYMYTIRHAAITGHTMFVNIEPVSVLGAENG